MLKAQLFAFQYIRQCVLKQQRPQLSIKIFRELIPSEPDRFIRPVHAGAQATAKGDYGEYWRRGGHV